MQVKAHLIQNSARIASWTLMRQEIFEITRTQQYTDSQPVSMQIGAHPKSKGKGKDSKDKGKSKDAKGGSKDKDAKNESSKKVKGDDQRSCYYCQKTGHVKPQCKTRLKDLADTEGKPVTANSHLNDIAAVVPSHCSLPNEHAMTCHMVTPCVEKKTPCEYFNVETMMRPTAGSTAPTWTERVKLTSAIPTCETFVKRDTCAGGGICPRGPDQTAQNDTTVVTMQLVTAPDDPAHENVGKSHFGSRDGRKLQVHDDGDVSFPTVSIGEASQRGNWFAGCRAMWPGLSGKHHTTLETDSNAIKLEKHRGVCWFPGTGDRTTERRSTVSESRDGQFSR